MKLRFENGGVAAGQRIGHDMIRRADAARDAGDRSLAAFLYGEAVRLLPKRGDLHVQQAHMLKELGDHGGAAAAYGRAADIIPDDPDLALQFGHLYKSQGRLGDAQSAYARALELKPGWGLARLEIEALRRLKPVESVAQLAQATLDPPPTIDTERPLLLAAALAPRGQLTGLHAHSEEIAVRRLGKIERTPWGVMHVLRGVQAFRGFCISRTPVVLIEIFLNGQMIHRGTLRGGLTITHERDDPDLRRYVFNAWIDLTAFAEGRYDVDLRATDIEGRALQRTEPVVIAAPIPPSPLPDSDTQVPPGDPADPRPLDVQINSRPSMVRPARRALLNATPRTMLVMRPDVLGDLVVAVPALQRLRAMFPDTRIVGLLSPGNVDLARTLGLFDEIVLTELIFDPHERRRIVSAANQRKLADDLARYEFDLAIDLGTSPDSRLLLPLSRAPVMVGFRTEDLPGMMTVEVTGGTKDPWNGHENVPHTNMAVGLVDWLGAMMRSEPTLLRREGLCPTTLAVFGLSPDVRFVVLHAGARWAFARWPYYPELAQLLLKRTELHVLLMTNDPDATTTLPPGLIDDLRFQIVDRRLHFDELDALVSYCALFVGDDSGVKHLASMRGAKVIGIQNARNNWSEWGQDNGGYIITRKVPCAGCLIQNYPESDECGRDFVCITAIRPAEVLDAALDLLANGA